MQTRSELQAFSARRNALELKARAERSTLLPQICVSGGYTYVDNTILDRKDFSMVSVGVRWNLFDGGQARNRSASLRAASRDNAGLDETLAMYELAHAEGTL